MTRSPNSTNCDGSFCAIPNANRPGLYPPEYRKRARSLVGLGILGSEYPPAYLSVHTPLISGLYTGSLVGLSASSFSMASLIDARSDAEISPEDAREDGR